MNAEDYWWQQRYDDAMFAVQGFPTHDHDDDGFGRCRMCGLVSDDGRAWHTAEGTTDTSG